MIHKQSFLLGYDAAVAEGIAYCKAISKEEGIHFEFNAMPNEHAYNIARATIKDTAAMAGIVEHIGPYFQFDFQLDGTIIVTDQWDGKWRLLPVMNRFIMFPFIIEPLEVRK